MNSIWSQIIVLWREQNAIFFKLRNDLKNIQLMYSFWQLLWAPEWLTEGMQALKNADVLGTKVLEWAFELPKQEFLYHFEVFLRGLNVRCHQCALKYPQHEITFVAPIPFLNDDIKFHIKSHKWSLRRRRRESIDESQHLVGGGYRSHRFDGQEIVHSSAVTRESLKLCLGSHGTQ